MQLVSKHNNMYNNGNIMIINLKTSSSKPNSNNKIVCNATNKTTENIITPKPIILELNEPLM
jgi:hypothetical protein